MSHPRSERPEAHIAAYATAAPLKVPTDHFVEVVNRHRENRGQSKEIRGTFAKLCTASGIKFKNWNPYSFHENTERSDTVSQGKKAGEPGPGEHSLEKNGTTYSPAERQLVFDHIACQLSLESAKAVLTKWGGDVSTITDVVVTCTSGWREPGIASHLIHELGLSLSTKKIELNFNGCFAGLSCVRTARDLVRAGDNENERRVVLVVATEISSVQYSPDVCAMTDLVAASLFGDGSGAFIVAPEGPWRLEQSGCSLIPQSKHLLGMSPHGCPAKDPERNCFFMGLHPKAGDALGQFFSDGAGAEIVKEMLINRKSADYPEVAAHPGGPKILDYLGSALIKQGFSKDCLQLSYETLFNNGNLGAAAIFFVLESVLSTTTKDEVIAFPFGPGVTVEHTTIIRTPETYINKRRKLEQESTAGFVSRSV